MAASMRDIRICICGRPGFEYNDGVFRCLVGHEVTESIDERGDAA